MAGSMSATYCKQFGSQKLYFVTCITTPPIYDKTPCVGNLALLKTSPSFKYSDTIQKIDLHNSIRCETVNEAYYLFRNVYNFTCHFHHYTKPQTHDYRNFYLIRPEPKDKNLTEAAIFPFGSPLVIWDTNGKQIIKGVLVKKEKEPFFTKKKNKKGQKCDQKISTITNVEKKFKNMLYFLNLQCSGLNNWISTTLNLQSNNH